MAPAHDTGRSHRPVAGRAPEPGRSHSQTARWRPVAARTGIAAARSGARGAGGRRRGGHRSAGLERSPLSGAAARDSRLPAVAVVPGPARGARHARRGHRRRPLGVGGRYRDCGSSGRRSGRAGHHRRQRTRPRCGRRGSPRRPALRAHGGRDGVRRRSRLSGRARGAGPGDYRLGPGDERIRPGHGAAAVPLSPTKPRHQRAR